ncbi:MAG: hypothetical protein Edafosvirus21_7 [Edafosvirus sp.]|uniref:Uncharacterized protein n=1 Tax=Edafosvirus sp. TaxID=2487765 RepID=A0A3G4ZUQ3_9VIRU|nr:MAG: hypothetical protein Edafosvirus21_7 [Edafosvirus sp.]
MTDYKTIISELSVLYNDELTMRNKFNDLEKQEKLAGEEKKKLESQLLLFKNNKLVIDTFNKKFCELSVGDYVYFKTSIIPKQCIAVWIKLKIIVLDKVKSYVILDNGTLCHFTSFSIVVNKFIDEQYFVPVIENDELTQKMIKTLIPDTYAIHFLKECDYNHVETFDK